MHALRRAFLGAVLAAALVAVLPSPASAHTGRTVGAYVLTVGWGTEPAYAGYPNSVQLLLEDTHHKAVTDLGTTLQVEVSLGSDKKTMPLEPHFRAGAFGTPGDYRAFLVPTDPGRYTFRFFGTIKGQKVDTSFTAGPNTFSEMEAADGVQFPAKVPSGAEISDRLDREIPRMDAKLTAAAKEADDAAASARMVGIIGIVVGALGLGAGGAALARKR